MIQVSKPDFSIGKLLATPAALEALQEANVDVIDLVDRHVRKDWGDLSDDNKRLNDEALHETRLASHARQLLQILCVDFAAGEQSFRCLVALKPVDDFGLNTAGGCVL